VSYAAKVNAERYPEPILHARQALSDLREAERRFRSALREALPANTPVRFTAHNGRRYDGVIVGWPELGTGVVVRNRKTLCAYEIDWRSIEGLHG
jgi:hypothetical protein